MEDKPIELIVLHSSFHYTMLSVEKKKVLIPHCSVDTRRRVSICLASQTKVRREIPMQGEKVAWIKSPWQPEQRLQ